MECEVSIALNQMTLLKASGPNRMPPLFYQHFWGTMDKDVTSSILSWLNTDDSLLFCRVTVEECVNVLKNLEAYEGASGQKVNKDKTTLFFSRSTLDNIKSSIKQTLGVKEILQYEKYLGLPSLVEKGKKSSFNYIKERLWRKLQG